MPGSQPIPASSVPSLVTLGRFLMCNTLKSVSCQPLALPFAPRSTLTSRERQNGGCHLDNHLTTAQLDRAVGVLLASAAGDALGAGYEFTTGDPNLEPLMLRGIGNDAPGGWTDDTAQALAIANVAADGCNLRTSEALDRVAQGFADWFADGPPDVGVQTAQVLRLAGRQPTGSQMTTAAADVHQRTGRSAGNGSLMRTGPVALANLHDPKALVEAAQAVSALTHHDPLAGEGCAVWSLAIRHAVLTGELPTFDDIAEHVPNVDYWRDVFDEAERSHPSTFTANGWVVGALQAAWSAINWQPITGPGVNTRPLERGLVQAVRIGHDTDTVAAIAGQLLGARWGASAVAARWRRMLHGWPGQTSDDLERLATLIVTAGEPLIYGWPLAGHIDYTRFGGRFLVEHPHDPGVLLGSAPQLDDLPDDVDAVISLCLLGTEQVPDNLDHVTFRLIDSGASSDNPNLDYVLTDIAQTVSDLRAEDKTVFLHCVRAESRTPTAAIAYSLQLGIPLDQATADISDALENSRPNLAFREALVRLAEGTHCQPR